MKSVLHYWLWALIFWDDVKVWRALVLWVIRTCSSDNGRSQWSRGLRYEISSPARTLGSWVPIPIEAWKFVCVYSVFVLYYVQIAALQRADHSCDKSYRLYIRYRNWTETKRFTDALCSWWEQQEYGWMYPCNTTASAWPTSTRSSTLNSDPALRVHLDTDTAR
jgi:hypothetical protein